MGKKKHIIDVPDVEKIGVYGIYNKVTDKYYIGSSVNIKRRCAEHRNNIENMRYVNSKIAEDLNKKSDIKNFSFIVLETFEDMTITDRQLRDREYYYILEYNAYNGYNTEYARPYPSGTFGVNEKLVCSAKRIHGYNFECFSNSQLLGAFGDLVLTYKHNTCLFAACKREILKRMDK